MSLLDTKAVTTFAELETFLYGPRGSFEQLNTYLTEEGTVLGGVLQVIESSDEGAVRLSGRVGAGVVVDLGKNQGAILSENWQIRGLIPSSGPLSMLHQIHTNRPGRPTVLYPVHHSSVAGEQLIAPVPPLKRLEFATKYKQLVEESLGRLGLS